MEIVKELKKISGVETVLVVDKTGIPAGFFDDKSSPEISAMTASLLGLGGYYINKFGGEDLECITIEGSKTQIFLFPYMDRVFIVSSKNMGLKEQILNIVRRS